MVAPKELMLEYSTAGPKADYSVERWAKSKALYWVTPRDTLRVVPWGMQMVYLLWVLTTDDTMVRHWVHWKDLL